MARPGHRKMVLKRHAEGTDIRPHPSQGEDPLQTADDRADFKGTETLPGSLLGGPGLAESRIPASPGPKRMACQLAGLAYVAAPWNSTATMGSVPTTQASWPGPIRYTSPAPISASVPSP